MSVKDINRLLRQPDKHYVAARQQQGRSLLDADFNEGESAAAEQQRLLLEDAIGPAGSPDAGFAIGRVTLETSPTTLVAPLNDGDRLPVDQVQIGGNTVAVHEAGIEAGAIYVGGARFVLEQPEPVAMQRAFLQMGGAPGDLPALTPLSSPAFFSPHSPRSPHYPEFRDFYYLNAWEQAVTAAEDDEILERGLAGPDAAVRVHRMRRVEVLGNLSPSIGTCADALGELERRFAASNGTLDPATGELRSSGRLQLVFQQPQEPTDCPPCTPDPPPEYLGAENETLRLMLTGPASYVWAIDNSAPLYRVKVSGLGDPNPQAVKVTMLTPPRDAGHQPKRNQVVEIIPFGAVLDGGEHQRPQDPHFQKLAAEVGVFARVAADFDPSQGSFQLESGPRVLAIKNLISSWDPRHPAAGELNIGPGDGSDSRFFFMRIWHTADTADQIELPISGDPNGAPLGDSGIVPVFFHGGRAGDFWEATLRIDARQQIVPFDLLTAPGGVPPHGPRHFYAPLALLTGADQQVFTVSDCRTPMRRLTERGCATRTVGQPGVSDGDFTSIQAAVDSLPAGGGLVQVLPGTYLENVSLDGLTGVSIQGCGPSTIVQSPVPGDGGTPGDLFSATQAQGITISDMVLNAARAAVNAVTVTDLQLSGLHVVAGDIGDGAFVAGIGGDDSTLLAVIDCTTARLSDIKVDSWRKQAIHVDACNDAALDEIDCLGAQDIEGQSPAASPLINVEASVDVRIRRSRLQSFAQFGLGVLASEEVLIQDLTATVGPAQTGDGGESQALSAIDVLASNAVNIERAFVTMTADATDHAGVRLLATDVSFSDGRIETLAVDPAAQVPVTAAWGGLQVRGGSFNVRIVGNDIVGGLGHGITLGAAFWLGSDGTERDEGAGKAQIATVGGVTAVTGDLTAGFTDGEVTFSARIGSPIADLVIADNRITRMGTNGISALTVLGIPSGQPFVEVQNAVISDNSITGNLVQIADGAVPTRTDVFPTTFSTDETRSGQAPVVQYLPYAGIALATASFSLDLRGNSVTDNGTSPVSPISGVFVLLGESLVISDNRITGNGVEAVAATPPAAGVRAGIAVVFADRPFAPSGSSTPTESVDDIGSLETLVKLDQPDLDQSGPALRLRGNSVLHPEGRALFAVATGPVSVTANFFSSRGYHGNSALPESQLIGDVVYLENLARPWESFRFSSESLGQYTVLGSNTSTYLSTGGSPYQFISFGGPILFQGNQVIYDWLVHITPPSGTPLGYVPVALISTDHVTMTGNHFALRVRPDQQGVTSLPAFGTVITAPAFSTPAPLLANAFSGGGTNLSGENRFSESPDATALSLLTWGELANFTSFNQATHIAVGYSFDAFIAGPQPPANVQVIGNQTVFLLNSPSVADLLPNGNMAQVVRQLFRQPQKV
ncbi:MAG TPA: DUF6519 domain-containing protein [Polyangia bacterium]|nr:DUF6519 domain-containing protein [Polyangia bacterium]